MAGKQHDTRSSQFALGVEVLLCLATSVACMWQLYAVGRVVESLGLLLVSEYGLYRVVAPLLATPTRSDRGARTTATARTDGFLVGQLVLPLVFASSLAVPGGACDVQFWASCCLSLHATIVSKVGRRRRNTVAAMLAAMCVAAAYFGLGGGYAHLLLVGFLFDALFEIATTQLSNVFSRGEAVITCEGVAIFAVDCIIRVVCQAFGQTMSPIISTTSSRPQTEVENVVQVLLVGVFVIAVGLYPMLVEVGLGASIMTSPSPPVPSSPPSSRGLRRQGSRRQRGGLWAVERSPRSEDGQPRARPRSTSSGSLLLPPANDAQHSVSLTTSQTMSFYGVVGGVVAILIIPSMAVFLGREPVGWLFEFLVDVPMRLQFVVFWASVLVAVVMLHPRSSNMGVANIIVRKVFHAVALLMFVPAMMVRYDMLYLGFGVATAGLLVVEFVRVFRVAPVGVALHRFMHVYVDSRDAGPLILTHIYLLLGCAIPLWLCGSTTGPGDAGASTQGIMPHAGIISLGVGDAVAASIGFTYGRTRWWGTKKTLLGTSAAVVSMLAATLALQLTQDWVCPGCTPIWPTSLRGFFGLCMATVGVCLMETFTTQVDNLVVPLYFFAMLRISAAWTS